MRVMGIHCKSGSPLRKLFTIDFNFQSFSLCWNKPHRSNGGFFEYNQESRWISNFSILTSLGLLCQYRTSIHLCSVMAFQKHKSKNQFLYIFLSKHLVVGFGSPKLKDVALTIVHMNIEFVKKVLVSREHANI